MKMCKIPHSFYIEQECIWENVEPEAGYVNCTNCLLSQLIRAQEKWDTRFIIGDVEIMLNDAETLFHSTTMFMRPGSNISAVGHRRHWQVKKTLKKDDVIKIYFTAGKKLSLPDTDLFISLKGESKYGTILTSACTGDHHISLHENEPDERSLVGEYKVGDEELITDPNDVFSEIMITPHISMQDYISIKYK